MSTNFKSWMINQFSHNKMADMVNHGVSGGSFSGLYYYSETTELYQKYKDDIWELLSDEAEAYGYSVLEMISQFMRAKEIDDASQFENLLVWYAAERVAAILTDGKYWKKDRRIKRAA